MSLTIHLRSLQFINRSHKSGQLIAQFMSDQSSAGIPIVCFWRHFPSGPRGFFSSELTGGNPSCICAPLVHLCLIRSCSSWKNPTSGWRVDPSGVLVLCWAGLCFPSSALLNLSPVCSSTDVKTSSETSSWISLMFKSELKNSWKRRKTSGSTQPLEAGSGLCSLCLTRQRNAGSVLHLWVFLVRRWRSDGCVSVLLLLCVPLGLASAPELMHSLSAS